MTAVSPDPPDEDVPDCGWVQMIGISHDNSTFTQVAGDQYIVHLPPDPPSPARCTLPADTAAFTGRARELEAITATVAAAAQAGQVVAIHALDGMPGVGKTALAVHVGHRLAERFPDRQLFVDLHAHTAGRQPTEPADALASLLIADGMDARYLPDDLDERAALWRDRMAHKQVLLILDNAASSGQVVPLLPGSAGCLVLVTSRRCLGDLPSSMVSMSLDVLSDDEARQMFVRLAPRAATDPARVREVVELCGRLPLAIALLARVFGQHASWTLEQLIEETRARLLSVVAENRTVAAVFDLSYECVPVERRDFFRRLGLHPGVDIDPYAAAALGGIPLERASEYLEALFRDRLVEEPVYRRYRMHDLIREYARGLAAGDPNDEQKHAVDRLVGFYRETATRAEAYLALYPRPGGGLPSAVGPGVGWDGQSGALGWLRAERGNLLAWVEECANRSDHVGVVGLTAGLASLLLTDGPWSQATTVHGRAVKSARCWGDQVAEVTALTDLGHARYLDDDYGGAGEVLERARELSREAGHRIGEATALYLLGSVRMMTGDVVGVDEVWEQALGVYRALGQRLGEAIILTNLGSLCQVRGDAGGAVGLLEQARGLYQDLGHQRGEAITLIRLGIVRRETGDLSAAAGLLDQARNLYHDLGDRLGETLSLINLGVVRWMSGDYPGAALVLEHARDLARDLGHRRSEADVLVYLGAVQREREDYPDAARLLIQARDLFRDLGDRHGEANACTELAVVSCRSGDYPAAARLLDHALDLYRAIGNPLGEAEALNRRGTLHLRTEHPDQALADHQHALELARTVDSPLEQARALHGTGRCALTQGDTATAIGHLRQALEIYQRLGTAEAAPLTAQLAELDAGS